MHALETRFFFSPSMKFCIGAKKSPNNCKVKNSTDTLLCEPNASANEIFLASEGNVLDVYANCDMGLKNVSS